MLAADAVGKKLTRRRRLGGVRWAVRGVLVLVIVGAFLVGFDGMFYYPSRTVHYRPADFGLRHEDVTFVASDGVRLHGWFLPATRLVPVSRRGASDDPTVVGGRGRSADPTDKADGATDNAAATAAAPAPQARGTVIHFHGNAANITNHIVLSQWLVWEGFNVFLFDYRGYGRSEGRPTREGTIRDGHAALDYVLSRPDVDRARVFAFGQSLGGAVATVVAAERPEIRAVVLDSTYSSHRRIAALHLQKLVLLRWPAEWIARAGVSGGYEPLDYIGRIAPRPLLVIASARDEICFAQLGRELFEAASEPKEFVLLEDGAHLESVADNVGNTQRRIVRFFEQAAASRD